MSRTDDLRQRGARDRTGGGGGAPFVHWGDSSAWVEGDVKEIWSSQYGPNVTMTVQARSNGLQAKVSDDTGKYMEDVEPGAEVNIGLNHAALEGTVTEADIGKRMHIAFEGWGESQKTGNRFRRFAVLEVPDPATGQLRDEVPSAPEEPPVEEPVGGSDSPDDDLPF